jgi:hypothetical protein
MDYVPGVPAGRRFLFVKAEEVVAICSDPNAVSSSAGAAEPSMASLICYQLGSRKREKTASFPYPRAPLIKRDYFACLQWVVGNGGRGDRPDGARSEMRRNRWMIYNNIPSSEGIKRRWKGGGGGKKGSWTWLLWAAVLQRDNTKGGESERRQAAFHRL